MTKKQRLKAADWIALGLKELARLGPEAIKLEAICTAAGLTRGSFYHHFDSHTTFLRELAEAWRQQSTEDVATTIDDSETAEHAAHTLTAAALEIDYKLELGIRELARRMPDIAAVVAETDRMRTSILAGIYAERFDLEAEAAKDYALLEYAAFSGLILLNPAMDRSDQTRLADRYESLIEQTLLKDL